MSVGLVKDKLVGHLKRTGAWLFPCRLSSATIVGIGIVRQPHPEQPAYLADLLTMINRQADRERERERVVWSHCVGYRCTGVCMSNSIFKLACPRQICFVSKARNGGLPFHQEIESWNEDISQLVTGGVEERLDIVEVAAPRQRWKRGHR